jgi:hypothetical protein
MKIIMMVVLMCLTVACKKQPAPVVELVEEDNISVEVTIPEPEILPEPEIVPVDIQEEKPKPPEPEMKRVCITIYDAKLKREVTKCDTIRVRKKKN